MKLTPKQWLNLYHRTRLRRGRIYTYNLVRGYEHHLLKPGDQVRFISLLPEFECLVEVETMDKRYSGKVHLMCLMLDRL